jgi:hypothetical protein
MAEKSETALIPRANGGYDYLVEEDRSTDDLRRDIAHRRESIVHTFDQANRKMRELLGWREQVRRHPYGALAGAAGLGFVLAGLFSRRRTAGERFVTTLTQNVEDIGGSLRNSIDPLAPSSSGVAQTVGATLIAMFARSLLHAAGNRFVTKPQTRATERRMP